MSGQRHDEQAGAATAEPVRRAPEIEEPTNLWVIHPIASRLTPLFAAWHIHPNVVSLAGMLSGVLAGIAYSRFQDVRCSIAGFLLMVAWHVMDGADGQLARLTHTQSRSGKVLDGACDYVTFTAVYVGFALTLSGQYGGWVWGLLAMAGVCHAVQAAAYEAEREDYALWGWGRNPAAPPAPGPPGGEAAAASSAQRLAERLHGLYAGVQSRLAGASAGFHATLGAILQSQPEHAQAIRRQYRTAFAPVVRRWSVLSSNYRTLGIFLSALAKVPLLYFCFEIVGFTAILLVLLSGRAARYARFLRGLQASEAALSMGPLKQVDRQPH